MIETQPLVSVVIAVYNEEPDLIIESINSILHQTYSHFEILIIDDSTSPATKNAIDTLAASDSRIRVIRHDKRIGFVPALNLGITTAKGKYIARMDGDDVSLPCRFAEEVSYMEQHPDVAVIGGAINIIDANGSETGERIYPENAERLALYRSPLAHPTVLMRKELAVKGFLYNESLTKAEDLDLWLRYIKNGYLIRNIPIKVLNYRISGNLVDKRGRLQYTTAYTIRKTHFSFKKPFFSVISVVLGFITSILPMSFFHYIYKQENCSKIRRLSKIV